MKNYPYFCKQNHRISLLKAKKYDFTDEEVFCTNEPIAAYASTSSQHRSVMPTSNKQNATRQRMRNFCREHFDAAFVAEMEERNFLINVPQPSNESEFEDLNQMFKEAEESGECTEEEVRLMFAV